MTTGTRRKATKRKLDSTDATSNSSSSTVESNGGESDKSPKKAPTASNSDQSDATDAMLPCDCTGCVRSRAARGIRYPCFNKFKAISDRARERAEKVKCLIRSVYEHICKQHAEKPFATDLVKIPNFVPLCKEFHVVKKLRREVEQFGKALGGIIFFTRSSIQAETKEPLDAADLANFVNGTVDSLQFRKKKVPTPLFDITFVLNVKKLPGTEG